MCAVSVVGDIYSHRFRSHGWTDYNPPTEVTRKEFLELQKEVREMKEILLKAKEYDKATGQPDCEVEDKIALLKKVAALVGVDLEEVFGK